MRIEVHRESGHLLTVLPNCKFAVRQGEHVLHEGLTYQCTNVYWRHDESMGQVEWIIVKPLEPPRFYEIAPGFSERTDMAVDKGRVPS